MNGANDAPAGLRGDFRLQAVNEGHQIADLNLLLRAARLRPTRRVGLENPQQTFVRRVELLLSGCCHAMHDRWRGRNPDNSGLPVW